MKKCTQCGIDKDETEFYKDKRHPDGRRYNCKSCQNKVSNKWRKENPENVKNALKKYYATHKEYWVEREKSLPSDLKEKKRQYVREYYKANRERILSESRERYSSKPSEEKKTNNQKYYEQNKEKICKRSREHSQSLSEEQKKANVERTKRWRQKNRSKSAAWSAVGNALLRGDMVKPNQCEHCCKNGCRLHAHHEDYEKPLEVVWLCHECHMSLHRSRRNTTNLI